jgi:hypothetical protein
MNYDIWVGIGLGIVNFVLSCVVASVVVYLMWKEGK